MQTASIELLLEVISCYKIYYIYRQIVNTSSAFLPLAPTHMVLKHGVLWCKMSDNKAYSFYLFSYVIFCLPRGLKAINVTDNTDLSRRILILRMNSYHMTKINLTYPYLKSNYNKIDITGSLRFKFNSKISFWIKNIWFIGMTRISV